MSSTATATEPAKEPAAKPPPTATQQALQRAGVTFAAVAFANAVFYFLSDRYFIERAAKHGPQELAGLDGTRFAFLVCSMVVGVAAFAAGGAPRIVGHVIAAATGALAVVAAFSVLSSDLSAVLGVTLLALGVLLPLAAHASWRGSRAAWSFLVSMSGVLALILLFAAPKLGRMFEISLWNAMILPGVLAVGTAALLLVHERYREH